MTKAPLSARRPEENGPWSATAVTAAEHQRRYRQRLARGDQFFMGELPYDAPAAMIDHGLIEPDSAADPVSVGRVLAALAERWGLCRQRSEQCPLTAENLTCRGRGGVFSVWPNPDISVCWLSTESYGGRPA
jgi:hypothetical protein